MKVTIMIMIMIMMDDRGGNERGTGDSRERQYVSRLLRSSLLRGRLEEKERTGVLLHCCG